MPFWLPSLPGSFLAFCLASPPGRPTRETLPVHGFAKRRTGVQCSYFPPHLSKKIPTSFVPWDCLLSSEAQRSDLLLVKGAVEHYMDHRFRTDVCVLTIYVPVSLPMYPQGQEFLMSLAAPDGRLNTRVLAGYRHAGGKESYVEAIFLDVTKTRFEMFAGTIMCYGQTGAGKTYTMTGATENYKHRGILPRALQQVESGPVGGISYRRPLYHRCCWSQVSYRRQWGPGVKGVAACREAGYTWWGVCVSETSRSWEFGFRTLTHACAVSSFVKEGVGHADWLLAALMVCNPVIEDLEVLITFLPGFNEENMEACRASRTESALGIREVWLKTAQKGLPMGSTNLGSVRVLSLEVGGKGIFLKSILRFYSPVL